MWWRGWCELLLDTNYFISNNMLSNIIDFFHYTSVAMLLFTKALDIYSTIHHVGPEGELNPIARDLFKAFGFIPGIFVVALIYAVVVSLQLSMTLQLSPTWKFLHSCGILVISWMQYDVARFNTTRIHSRNTKIILIVYLRWLRFSEKLKDYMRGHRRLWTTLSEKGL